MQTIQDIELSKLENHPQNVRKTYNDIDELADSIKAKGILQNLTVVPKPGEPEKYLVVIGNRRLLAAKKAGLEAAPCYISDMDEKEQASVMLLENIQRNDLTIYEQAQGFQMMLDFGETEDTISQKTGFSKTTVRHRLNIAKLNQKELQKKEQDESFQLSLKDLYELEKVKDIKTRNKILKEASSSRDIVSRAQSAVAEAKRNENAKIIIGMLKKLDVEVAPNEYENEMWSGKWKTVQEFELDKDAPKKIKLPDETEKMYFYVHYRSLKVVRKAPKGEKRELSKYELEEKERQKTKRQIKAILKESTARRTEFIRNIISGKVDPVKNEIHEIQKIWAALADLRADVSSHTVQCFFVDKDWYNCTDEEKQGAQKKAAALTTLHQMLIILNDTMARRNEPFNWKLEFDAGVGDALKKGYEALEPYGWFFENEDENKVLDGTHELYKKEPEK